MPRGAAAERGVRAAKKRGAYVDLDQARTEAQLITNPARQKLMLEVIDDLERCRARGATRRERLQKMHAQEDFIRANMARVVTDDLGRSWALAKALPDGSVVVDEAGHSWKYIAADRALTRISD